MFSLILGGSLPAFFMVSLWGSSLDMYLLPLPNSYLYISVCPHMMRSAEDATELPVLEYLVIP